MKIAIIAAMDKNGLIGSHGRLPWHIPADLKHFKQLTIGHVIVMGRKTYESIGKALPYRTNIVITHQSNLQAPNCIVKASLESALKSLETEAEVFIIGGAQIYRQSLTLADKLYLTEIDHTFEGDTYFPTINWKEWVKIGSERFPSTAESPYSYSFLKYQKLVV